MNSGNLGELKKVIDATADLRMKSWRGARSPSCR